MSGRNADISKVLGPALRKTVEDLGVTFVKLGQILASSPSIAGQVLSDEMRGLLDDGPPEPFLELQHTIETDTGVRFWELFAEFSPQPHAAASLAVVHKATLIDGTSVAVKILRPHASKEIAADLAILGGSLQFLAKHFPVGMVPSLPGVVRGLAEQLSEELDLRNEDRSMAWFAELTALIGFDKVRIPATFAHASGRRVLTMEFIEGSPVDDLERVEHYGHDGRTAMEDLLKAWFAVTLCTGVFHGDMHAGNLLFTEDGQVALLDWGILGRMNSESGLFLRRSIQGAMGDESAWPDVRTHLMKTLTPDLVTLSGLTEDQVFAMLRSQIEAIMYEPFASLNLMALMPTSPDARAQMFGRDEAPKGTRRERASFLLSERRRIRKSGPLEAAEVDRGEMLLVKQLVFFERYGKMYLADRPLIWDDEVFRDLLRLSEENGGDATESEPPAATNLSPSGSRASSPNSGGH
jgi:predicted unusual protein kinase regulating ubiquinone biosynthesis (AarF/ABC1/UbiB family)